MIRRTLYAGGILLWILAGAEHPRDVADAVRACLLVLTGAANVEQQRLGQRHGRANNGFRQFAGVNGAPLAAPIWESDEELEQFIEDIYRSRGEGN